MTRTQAIATITSCLDTLDDERLAELAELVLDDQSVLPRALSDREKADLAKSRADFKAGRTMSAAEAHASIDEFLATLGVAKSVTSKTA